VSQIAASIQEFGFVNPILPTAGSLLVKRVYEQPRSRDMREVPVNCFETSV
jgi:hypothetical protein